ncbi:MAG: hypothetical protein PHV42_00040 [Candidatus Pacebacteria bacterium]|nr:hypothetical protein [Candidatus Paceibacterota bacterium]
MKFTHLSLVVLALFSAIALANDLPQGAGIVPVTQEQLIEHQRQKIAVDDALIAEQKATIEKLQKRVDSLEKSAAETEKLCTKFVTACGKITEAKDDLEVVAAYKKGMKEMGMEPSPQFIAELEKGLQTYDEKTVETLRKAKEAMERADEALKEDLKRDDEQHKRVVEVLGYDPTADKGATTTENPHKAAEEQWERNAGHEEEEAFFRALSRALEQIEREKNSKPPEKENQKK